MGFTCASPLIFKYLKKTNSKLECRKNGVCPRLTLTSLSYFLKPIIALHAKPFQSIIIKRELRFAAKAGYPWRSAKAKVKLGFSGDDAMTRIAFTHRTASGRRKTDVTCNRCTHWIPILQLLFFFCFNKMNLKHALRYLPRVTLLTTLLLA